MSQNFILVELAKYFLSKKNFSYDTFLQILKRKSLINSLTD